MCVDWRTIIRIATTSGIIVIVAMIVSVIANVIIIITLAIAIAIECIDRNQRAWFKVDASSPDFPTRVSQLWRSVHKHKRAKNAGQVPKFGFPNPLQTRTGTSEVPIII